MQIEKILAGVLGLALLTGCAGPKAFLDLDAQQRQRVQFIANTNQRPDVRFASEAARNARSFGGLIAFAISEGIENSTNALGQAAPVVGTFEVRELQEEFARKLRAASVPIETPPPEASRLELRVHVVGVREVEREQFAPFAYASARLSARDGKELWTASAQSIGLHRRPMKSFHESPELYRKDFKDVVEDLVNQLVEGPVRSIRY